MPTTFWGGEALAWITYLRGGELAGVQYDSADNIALLGEWDALLRSCGWWWPFDGVVICAERHQQIHFDEQHRLHNERGPAIECRDGYKLHAWHGTRVPGEWIEQRESVDVGLTLTWENIEQRRALAEIIGWARVLERVPTRVINADRDPHIGTLLECDLPGAESSRFLKVKCGTGRDFVLSVPREMQTALEANAWTYGLESNDYQLEART